MGYTPPNPGKLSSLVAAAQSFAHDARSSGLRTPSGLSFPVAVAKSNGAVEWEIDTAATSCPIFMMSEATYAALRDGTVKADGYTLEHHGSSYLVRSQRHADGSLWVELAAA
jgi:hypothetical protein